MPVNSFEKLEIWKQGRELDRIARKLTSEDPFNKDFRFCSQITSAYGSIMNNITEVFERDGNKEFIQFLHIEKGSCGEVRSQGLRAFDAGFFNNEELTIILNFTENIKFKTN